MSKSLQKAEAAVKALQQAILDVGGEKLKKAVKRADAASRLGTPGEASVFILN